jgi:hypothetical protein
MNSSGIVVRTWNDAPISRRDSDGYADATAMCQANGKDWFDYQRLGRTTDYITALAGATGLQPAQLVITTTTGPNHLRGTWIHPRLAVDLARWISPAFAVWMDGWFLDALNAPPALAIKRCAHCGKQIESGTSRRYCSNACKQSAWRNRKALALGTTPTPSLPPGVHVIASSPRQANWLWKQAVEAEVSTALMRALAYENRQTVGPEHFQLHLLPA